MKKINKTFLVLLSLPSAHLCSMEEVNNYTYKNREKFNQFATLIHNENFKAAKDLLKKKDAFNVIAQESDSFSKLTILHITIQQLNKNNFKEILPLITIITKKRPTLIKTRDSNNYMPSFYIDKNTYGNSLSSELAIDSKQKKQIDKLLKEE